MTIAADLLALQPKPKRARIRTPESLVLSSVLSYLRGRRGVAWVMRCNTGAVKLDSRFLRFGVKGCADIIGQMQDGRFLAIECKAREGRLTTEQAAFLERVKRHGGVAGVARSIDDVDDIVEGRIG